MRHLAHPVLLFALLSPAVQATEFSRVQPDLSSIEFAYSQMGVPMDGRFRKFASQLSFDPARPADARVSIEIDLASIDTGTPELDAESARHDWFDLTSFPTARFTGSGAKPLGGNRYTVGGRLTIKGHSRDLVVPVTVEIRGGTAVFTGRFTIRRGDFAVGEGDWSAFDVVANDVEVRFRITALGQ